MNSLFPGGIRKMKNKKMPCKAEEMPGYLTKETYSNSLNVGITPHIFHPNHKIPSQSTAGIRPPQGL